MQAIFSDHRYGQLWDPATQFLDQRKQVLFQLMHYQGWRPLYLCALHAASDGVRLPL